MKACWGTIWLNWEKRTLLLITPEVNHYNWYNDVEILLDILENNDAA